MKNALITTYFWKGEKYKNSNRLYVKQVQVISNEKFKNSSDNIYPYSFYLALSSPAALAANIVIDKQAGPAGPGLFNTHNYANDSACIQAALDTSKSGDTITIRGGDYYLPKGIYQKSKSLNIIGKGKVTLHILTPDRVK